MAASAELADKSAPTNTQPQDTASSEAGSQPEVPCAAPSVAAVVAAADSADVVAVIAAVVEAHDENNVVAAEDVVAAVVVSDLHPPF